MKFKDFDFSAAKETSERLADLLQDAGIRTKQRTDIESGRLIYVIAVHADDFDRANQVTLEAKRREDEGFLRILQFVRERFTAKDMLYSREPNEAGCYYSGVYHGEPFDESRFELVLGGWDHEHCYLCSAKIWPGDEWWTAWPPNFEDAIGLCLECYARFFGGDAE